MIYTWFCEDSGLKSKDFSTFGVETPRRDLVQSSHRLQEGDVGPL